MEWQKRSIGHWLCRHGRRQQVTGCSVSWHGERGGRIARIHVRSQGTRTGGLRCVCGRVESTHPTARTSIRTPATDTRKASPLQIRRPVSIYYSTTFHCTTYECNLAEQVRMYYRIGNYRTAVQDPRSADRPSLQPTGRPALKVYVLTFCGSLYAIYVRLLCTIVHMYMGILK